MTARELVGRKPLLRPRSINRLPTDPLGAPRCHRLYHMGGPEFAVKRGGNSHRRPSPTSYRGAPANEGARGWVGLQRDAGCLAATWPDNGSSPVRIEIRGGVMAMGERLLRPWKAEEKTGMIRSAV